MELKNKHIKEIFRPVIENQHFMLIDLIIRGNTQNRIIEVFIDGDNPITTDDCAVVSKKLNSVIENQNLFNGKYRLDVSSPGIDKPLKFLRQYKKHLNRNFEVKYELNSEKKKLEGKLINIENETLIFLSKNDEIRLNFDQIIKAKVLISF